MADTAAAPRAWLRRRWLWAVLVLLLVFGGLRLALPGLLQQQLQDRGSALLGRAVTVGQVELALWDLAITVHDLKLSAAQGAEPQLQIRRLHVNADLRSLLRLAPVIEELQIDAPQLRLARLADGGYDVDDILARLRGPADAPPSEPARFALFNLQLRDGGVRFADQPVGKVHELHALQVVLPFLSNLPDDVKVKVEPRVAFRFDRDSVDIRGQTLPFSPDRSTELALAISGLQLAPAWAYLPGGLPLRPEGGVLSAQLALRFSQPPKAAPQLQLSGQVALQGLALAGATGTPRLAWQQLQVQLDDVQPLAQKVALGEVQLQGLRVELQRNRQGAVQIGSRATAAPARPAAAPASPPAPVWQVSARRASVDGLLQLTDAAVSPVTTWSLAALQLQLDGPRWPALVPVPLRGSAELKAGDASAATITIEGQASPSQAQLALALDDVQLGAAAPYLRAWLRPRIEGQAALQMKIDWAEGEAPRQRLSFPELELRGLRVVDTEALATLPAVSAPGPRGSRPRAAPATLRWDRLHLAGTEVDLLQRQLSLGRVQWVKPQLDLQRAADGVLNLSRWLVAAPADDPPTPVAADTSPAWRVDLRDLLIEGGALRWTDAAVQPQVTATLQGLRLALQGAAWPAPAKPARLSLQALLAAPAAADPAEATRAAALPRLALQGALPLQPAGFKGELELERIPVHGFAPYFAKQLPVQLARAELGWRGSVDLALPVAGPQLEARGVLRVADLDVRSLADFGPSDGSDDQLLSWNTLVLEPLRLSLAPGRKPRVEIGELALSDFYSRLVITEQGRFNLRDVQAPPAPAAAAGAASAAAAASAPSGLPIELDIGRTRLAGGKVDFSDRFIRPNYSAALTELNGSIGRFASGSREMAPLELNGRVAGTGQLSIRGAVNPTADPLALDISARASELELAPLSPYSGKYAGYAIERGKLSVDVAYRIDPDGKLEARNQIILNQLTFGDKVDSPEATKLPVRLAVSLLTDRNGVIDINLPISGSINDPQFSVWGIVWKIIGNLIAKALTAPFSLLAGGSGPELNTVAFLPGGTGLAEGSAQTLEKVAQALADRPALRLTLQGQADLPSEAAAMRAAALDARIAAEVRRERARAGTAAEAPVRAEEQARALQRLYTDTPLPGRPRNLIGLVKAVPAADMRKALEAAVPVTTDSARDLALQRSVAVRDALIARGLPSERLFLGGPKLRDAGEPAEAWQPRVELSLSSQ